MRARAVLAVALLAASTVTAAHAAVPRRACNLVVDPAGDTANDLEGLPVYPADTGLDIIGGDVASGRRDVTAVVRLAAEPGEARLYLKRYIARFNVAGLKNPAVLAASISATGTTYQWGYYGLDEATQITSYNYAGAATGSIKGRVVTVTVPLSAFAGNAHLGTVRRGAKVSAFTVSANRRLPAVTQLPGRIDTADEGTARTPYYAGGASCVPVA